MKLVQNDSPGLMWQQFFDAHGPEVMKASYDWPLPQVAPRKLETVYEFHMVTGLAGWGSLTRNPLSQEFWLAMGMLPAYTGHGYAKNFKTLLVNEAFEKKGAEVVTSHVLNTNPRYQDYVMRTVTLPWRFAGSIWFPEPGFKVFSVTYDDWNAYKCLAL